MRVDCIGKIPDWTYHEYFTIELLSIGTDIFDLKVFLESERFVWHRTRSWLRWSRMKITEQQQFKPTGDLPNPIKNGQVLSFALSDHFMCDWRATGHGGDLYRCPSQLWPWRVRIAAYHSGRSCSSDRRGASIVFFGSLIHSHERPRTSDPCQRPAPNKALQPTVPPLRGVPAAELERWAAQTGDT